jgi:hypothetical protein
MSKLAPLLLMLMVALPSGIAAPAFADPRDYSHGDGDRSDSYGDRGYDDQDDNDDGPSDHSGRHSDNDDDGDDDDGDYGAFGPGDDDAMPDDSSDGMRT